MHGFAEILPRIHDAHDVMLRLAKRRDAAVVGDGFRTGILSREDEVESIRTEALHEAAEVAGGARKILAGIMRVDA